MASRRHVSSLTPGTLEIGPRFGGPGWSGVRDDIGIGFHALRCPSDHIKTTFAVDPANQWMQVGVVVVFIDSHASLRSIVFESRQYLSNRVGSSEPTRRIASASRCIWK